RATRLPLDSITRLRRFRLSRVACTSLSVAAIAGERLVFWLQPETNALRVSGYVSGTVCCFSTSVPSTRVSSKVRSFIDGNYLSRPPWKMVTVTIFRRHGRLEAKLQLGQAGLVALADAHRVAVARQATRRLEALDDDQGHDRARGSAADHAVD